MFASPARGGYVSLAVGCLINHAAELSGGRGGAGLSPACALGCLGSN